MLGRGETSGVEVLDEGAGQEPPSLVKSRVYATPTSERVSRVRDHTFTGDRAAKPFSGMCCAAFSPILDH